MFDKTKMIEPYINGDPTDDKTVRRLTFKHDEHVYRAIEENNILKVAGKRSVYTTAKRNGVYELSSTRIHKEKTCETAAEFLVEYAKRETELDAYF